MVGALFYGKTYASQKQLTKHANHLKSTEELFLHHRAFFVALVQRHPTKPHASEITRVDRHQIHSSGAVHLYYTNPRNHDELCSWSLKSCIKAVFGKSHISHLAEVRNGFRNAVHRSQCMPIRKRARQCYNTNLHVCHDNERDGPFCAVRDAFLLKNSIRMEDLEVVYEKYYEHHVYRIPFLADKQIEAAFQEYHKKHARHMYLGDAKLNVKLGAIRDALT